MRVIVKPLGYLRSYLKEYLRDEDTQAELFVDADAISVRELLEHFGFEMNRVGLVICNDKNVRLEYMLNDGDRITVMSLMGGG